MGVVFIEVDMGEWYTESDGELMYDGTATALYRTYERECDRATDPAVYDWLWESKPHIDIVDQDGDLDFDKRMAFLDACSAGLPALKAYLGYDELGVAVETERSALAADPIITINIAACNTAADYRMVAEIMEKYSSVKVVK